MEEVSLLIKNKHLPQGQRLSNTLWRGSVKRDSHAFSLTCITRSRYPCFEIELPCFEIELLSVKPVQRGTSVLPRELNL